MASEGHFVSRSAIDNDGRTVFFIPYIKAEKINDLSEGVSQYYLVTFPVFRGTKRVIVGVSPPRGTDYERKACLEEPPRGTDIRISISSVQ